MKKYPAFCVPSGPVVRESYMAACEPIRQKAGWLMHVQKVSLIFFLLLACFFPPNFVLIPIHQCASTSECVFISSFRATSLPAHQLLSA